MDGCRSRRPASPSSCEKEHATDAAHVSRRAAPERSDLERGIGDGQSRNGALSLLVSTMLAGVVEINRSIDKYIERWVFSLLEVAGAARGECPVTELHRLGNLFNKENAMSMEVTDSVGALTSAQRAELQGISSPHRVKAFFENPESQAQLKEHALACVDTPNTICIGVSPALRFTWTEIGLDTGIRSGDYQQVGRAGNADFKAAVLGTDANGWSNGVKAIVSRAQVLAHQHTAAPTPVVIQEHSTVVEHPVSAQPFIVGFGALALLVALVAVVIYRLQKRTERALENSQRETAELAQRNILEERWESALRERVDGSASGARAGGASARGELRPFRGRVKLGPAPRGEVVVAPDSSDLAAGIIMGQAMRAAAPYQHTWHPSAAAPAPAPQSYASTPSSTPTSSSWSSSSSSSSFDSYSSGGGGGSFDSNSGGGGGGSF
jgi:uncharacterized membrane protein YgcG